MDLQAGHRDRGHPARPRVPRLVHQRAHRGPARGRGGRARTQAWRRTCRRWSCPAPGLVKAQAEQEGLDKIFIDAGFEWRDAGCSMCLGMNPDILLPGRALRLDVQPQLRGAAGPGRPHAPREPADGRRGRDRRPLRRHPAMGARLMEPVRTDPRQGRCRSTARRRRHRPDHPGEVPQAHRAHGLRRVRVRRVAQGPGLRAERPPLRRRARCSSRARTSAAARRASTRRGRCSRWG